MFSHGPIPKDEASIVHALLNDINIDKVWLTSPWGGRIVWKKKTITYDSGRKRTIRVPALGYHQGKDIQPKGAKKRGTGIYSPITGKVFILPGGYSEHNGICIWDSTNNIAVVLLHMDVINPNTGVPYFSEYSTVEKGDQVGRMADIGSEDKVHLHYSIGMCYKENDAKNATFLSYQSYLKGQQEWNRLYGSQIKVDPHQCHIADAYEEWEKSPGSGLRKPYPDPLVLDVCRAFRF
jgi:murein DD-endopeptidase MepM/ murein hydrolase activator NlpD